MIPSHFLQICRIFLQEEDEIFPRMAGISVVLRMHAFGIPHYDISHFANFTELMPGVFHVTGSTHHSFVVEMNDHIVVVEPPLYEERSQVVINEIVLKDGLTNR